MKEYKSLDFYTESSEPTVHTKVKDDLIEMMKLGWQPIFTLKFANTEPDMLIKSGDYTTVFFKKETIEE